MSLRVCSDCSAPVSYKSTGRCRGCANRQPRSLETSLRRSAAIRARLADPVVKAALVAASAQRLAAWRASPEGRQQLLAGLAAKRASGIARSSEVRLAWCPPAWRDRYRELRRLHRAPLARKKVAEEIAAAAEAERIRIAALSPFERQMERVRNGAKLYERVPAPSREYAYTLGGVSWA